MENIKENTQEIPPLIFTFAKPWQRILAYTIDIIPITLIVFCIFYLFLDFDQTLHNYLNNKNSFDARIEFLVQRNYIRDLSLIIWLIYSFFMECSTYQATLGKKLVGIKVVDEFGQPLTFSVSAKRSFGKLLASVPYFLGFVWIFFTAKKQGWHDKLAKTYVVVRRKVDI